MPVMVPPSKKAAKIAYNLIGIPQNVKPVRESHVVRTINKVIFSSNGARLMGIK